jgi:hypothetical protein
VTTSPDMAPPYEPVSAEVARVDDRDQRHELDKLRDTLRERALVSAGRAEGAANVVGQQVLELGKDHGGRLAVLEDHDRETRGDLKAIKATVDGIKSTLETLAARSPVQQALYSLTALTVFAYFASLLWEKHFGGGG